MLIDTHAHLTDQSFDADRAEVIARAKTAGISRMIEIACEPRYWRKALDLAAVNDGIACALGIHPQEAKLCTEAVFKELEQLIKHPSVCAVGETGFDYHYENSPRDQQREVFEKHIGLSLSSGKPLVMHCREAYPDMLEVLKAHKCHGVVHCFSGSLKDCEALLSMGFYLGIDGPVTYPKAGALREAVKIIPLERILIETDSPYLPPQAYRGKRNEPAYARFISEEIAKIKLTTTERVMTATSLNAAGLFGLQN